MVHRAASSPTGGRGTGKSSVRVGRSMGGAALIWEWSGQGVKSSAVRVRGIKIAWP